MIFHRLTFSVASPISISPQRYQLVTAAVADPQLRFVNNGICLNNCEIITITIIAVGFSTAIFNFRLSFTSRNICTIAIEFLYREKLGISVEISLLFCV